MCLSRVLPAALVAAVLAFPGAAWALSFAGHWSLDAINSADPGLVVKTDETGGAFAADLAVGESAYIHLFKIWTDEGTVNKGEDETPKPIEVGFDFSNPATAGAASGITAGKRKAFGLFQGGVLTWDGPLMLNFGAHGSGQLTLALTDATFNWGLLGTKEGYKYGDYVKAKLTYDMAPVPVPAALPLLLGGIGVIGLAGWRRRAA